MNVSDIGLLAYKISLVGSILYPSIKKGITSKFIDNSSSMTGEKRKAYNATIQVILDSI